LQEAFSSFIGVGELAFGKGDAMGRYNLTPQGFWRVFICATVLMPLFMTVLEIGNGEPFDLVSVIGLTLLRVPAIALTCMVIIRVRGMIVAQGMGLGGSLDSLGPGTLPFLVPFLWALTVQAIVASLMKMGGNPTAMFLEIVILVTSFIAQWRAARQGLGLSGAASLLMVLAFVVSQTIIFLLMLTALAVLHGGSLHLEVN
jgi:hypothetical protein